jgi:steroid delta-isomerase-like uncharacterized protein
VFKIGATKEDQMADAAETARRYDAAFDEKDTGARMAHLTPDTEVVMPGGMTLRGADQVAGLVQVFWEAVPDGRLTRETEVVAGDTVVTEGTLTGTHTGIFRTPQREIPASGNRVMLRYASVKEIREGKITSERLYFDQLELLQQLGALPPTEQ